MTTKMATSERRKYMRLVASFPLVSVQSERQLEHATAVMNELLRRDPLSPGEEAYLNALSDLVMVYEAEHHPIPDASGAEMLAHLMEAREVRQVDVCRGTGIAKSTIAQILAGKRRISQSHLPTLARFFAVSPAVFLPRPDGRQKPKPGGRAAG